jgi:hypothetical protein
MTERTDRTALAGRLALLEDPERYEAAYRLAGSGNAVDVAAALALLAAGDTWVRAGVRDGLAEREPPVLAPVIDLLRRTPLDEPGRDCAHVLGEIAYRQGRRRDPRIVGALLEAAGTALPHGTRTASAALGALRECARAGPLPEAESVARAALQAAAEEPEPYLWTVDNALAILHTGGDRAFRREVEARRRALPPDHPLAEPLEEFLRGTAPSAAHPVPNPPPQAAGRGETVSDSPVELTLELPARQVSLSEPVHVRFTLRNPGPQPVTVNGRLLLNTPYAPASARELTLQVEGPEGYRSTRAVQVNAGRPQAESFVVLAPGESRSASYELTRFQSMHLPGRYLLRATYRSAAPPDALPGTWLGPTESAPVELQRVP